MAIEWYTKIKVFDSVVFIRALLLKFDDETRGKMCYYELIGKSKFVMW